MNSNKLLQRLVLSQVRRSSSHSAVPPRTISDLPSPKGDWKLQHDANNRRYNLHLLLGVSSLIGTIAVGKAAGWLEFYDAIPERPADIASYK